MKAPSAAAPSPRVPALQRPPLAETIQVIISGLTAGAIYGLVALSYNVIYAASGILNFAQGTLLMSGTMIGAWLFGEKGWPVLPVLGLALLIGAGFAVVEERIAVRPAIERGDAIGWVVATLGFAVIMEALFAIVLGPDTRPFPSFISDAPHDIAGAVYSFQQVALIVVALAVGFLLHAFYTRTRMGWALTAISQDHEAAVMRGIPVRRLVVLAFALGGAIAAGTGFLAAPIIGASPTLGFSYALAGFVAAALGGIPDLRGAVIGGFALGLIEALGVKWFGAEYKDIVVFGVLIAVLAIKPTGLFSRGAVRTV